MYNLREVSNSNKSTGIEYFSNNNSVKKKHEIEISTQKILHLGFSFKTQIKIGFFTTVYWW